jgi:hypothetical protein
MKVFCSYSSKDKELKDELKSQFSSLIRKGSIVFWDDGEILPGNQWATEIKEHLLESNIILFLLSPDFIESRYCIEVELKEALVLEDEGKTVIVPIILRYCDWEDTEFSSFQVLPEGGKPATDVQLWGTKDKAYYSIVKSLKKIINKENAAIREPMTGKPRGIPDTIFQYLLLFIVLLLTVFFVIQIMFQKTTPEVAEYYKPMMFFLYIFGISAIGLLYTKFQRS